MDQVGHVDTEAAVAVHGGEHDVECALDVEVAQGRELLEDLDDVGTVDLARELVGLGVGRVDGAELLGERLAHEFAGGRLLEAAAHQFGLGQHEQALVATGHEELLLAVHGRDAPQLVQVVAATQVGQVQHRQVGSARLGEAVALDVDPHALAAELGREA